MRSEDSPYSPGAARVGWALNCFLNIFKQILFIYAYTCTCIHTLSFCDMHSLTFTPNIRADLTHTHTHLHNTCTRLTRSPANTDLNSLSRRRSSPLPLIPTQTLSLQDRAPTHAHPHTLVHTHTQGSYSQPHAYRRAAVTKTQGQRSVALVTRRFMARRLAGCGLW